MDAKETVADTVVITDGIITYVGDAEGAKEFFKDGDKVIDLEGNTVMPSMVHSHMHPGSSAISYYYEIGLQDDVTVEEYQQTIQEFIAEKPDLDVYTGSGYMRSSFDSVGPRKETLDAVCAEKPVIITSVDGHSCWVNSKALELAGITAESQDPDGGIIQRDPETGEPCGLLLESAMNLVAGLKPEYTKGQYKEAIKWLQSWLNGKGVTTIYDAMIPLDNENYYMAFQELAAAGELTIRVRGAWHLAPEMGTETELMAMVDDGIKKSKGFTTDYFQVNSFKFFADQVVEEETAYMAQPYNTRQDGWRGMKVWDDSVMEALFLKIDKAGFQIHVHQIGDAAATYTLDILEKVQEINGERDSRHTFAHVQFISEEDQQRLADLKMNAIIAPYWFAMDDYYWGLYLPSLGQERVNHMYPAQSLFDKGINVATHSDFFVTEPELGWLLYSAVTRTLPQKWFDAWYEGMDLTRTTDVTVEPYDDLIGPLPQPEERLTLGEAVKATTYNGAYANFMDDEIGSIEVGKKADLVLLDMNIFEEDIENVSEVTPAATIFDGRIVYEAANS